MSNLLTLVADCTAAFAGVGVIQALCGLLAVRRYCSQPAGSIAVRPPVTILKPLHGDEPMLEQALASFFAQDYPEFQIVFGLQDADDPALVVIHRLCERFPLVDVAIVIDGSQHGINRKVSNLINMYPAARYDLIVIADSDIHAPPNYLMQLATCLAGDGVGLVTTLYAGLRASDTVAAHLGAAQINHSFLPGALMARLLGREDCLGATMALTRGTLEGVGGLQAMVHNLADDAVLGRLVAARGYRVALAATLPATTIPEVRISQLFAHELRWGRTIQSVAPIGFLLSSLQHPLFWAVLAVLLSGFADAAILLFAATWLVRAGVMFAINRALRLDMDTPLCLLPLRDVLSIAVILASYGGREVAWRGHVIEIVPPRLVVGKGMTVQ